MSARLAVVAAALVVDGRVLAARRVRPVGWEFPGGKVEPGEEPGGAIERECREELGVQVRAIEAVAAACDERIALQLWRVELVDGTPRALADHVEVRWLGADELTEVPWLAIDRELLTAVRAILP